MYDLILSIVKTKAVPRRMFVTGSGVKELIGVTGQIAQPFHFILDSMTLNQIHDDRNAVLMGFINKSLEVFGRTEPAGGCEETAHMIPETSIIGMFLKGHNLQTIITFLNYTGKYLLTELIISTDFLSILCHAYMAFVNEQWVTLRPEIFLLEDIRLLQLPHLCTEYFSHIILYHTPAPSWNTLPFSAIPINLHFIKVFMAHRLGRQFYFPITTVTNRLKAIGFIFLPIIKIANEINFCSIRCPFTENPLTGCLVKTEIKIAASKLRQGDLSPSQFVQFMQYMVMTSFYGIVKRLEPGIILNDLQAHVTLLGLTFCCGLHNDLSFMGRRNR